MSGLIIRDSSRLFHFDVVHHFNGYCSDILVPSVCKVSVQNCRNGGKFRIFHVTWFALNHTVYLFYPANICLRIAFAQLPSFWWVWLSFDSVSSSLFISSSVFLFFFKFDVVSSKLWYTVKLLVETSTA